MPARSRTSDLKILIVAGGLTVLLSILSFFIAPVDSTSQEDGSSYSSWPGGAKAAFLMLKAAGYPVERSFEPITALRSSPGRTLLILARPSRTPSLQDVRALRAFVDAGGIVLCTDHTCAAFLPGVPARAARLPPGQIERVDAAMASPMTAGVPSIEMARNSAPIAASSPYITVYGDDLAPAVVMARTDRGAAVWWADSRPLTNESIASPGHAELLVNTAGAPGDRVVLWDEHYHGHSRSLWSYTAETPLPLAGAQVGLLALAALLTWSRRKWPVRSLPVEPRTSPLEFVDSMGALYRRAGVASTAVGTIRARVRRALLAATGLPSSSDDASVSAAVAARCSADVEQVRVLFTESAAASIDFDLRPDAAVRIVAGLQQLARDVQLPRPPRRPPTRSQPSSEGEEI
jgi:hypothetical protein